MIIDRKYWSFCKICGMSLSDIKIKTGGSNVYFSKAFKKHITEHKLSLFEYFNQYEDFLPKKCPCGICNKTLGITTKSSQMIWKSMACGRNKGVMEWSKKAKTDRLGSNNPSYGKKPWNLGKTKTNDNIMLSISKKMSNRKVSDIAKKNMSISAKKREVHGHTNKKHSLESKEKCRIATLRRINNGDFKQTKTVPHIVMSNILNEINIRYIEEYIVNNWCFDFYLLDLNILLEVDGDYWHSNPKIYPDGPITKTQKINKYRDIVKDKYCKDNNLVLLRFWESDILNKKEEIKLKICQLKK